MKEADQQLQKDYKECEPSECDKKREEVYQIRLRECLASGVDQANCEAEAKAFAEQAHEDCECEEKAYAEFQANL